MKKVHAQRLLKLADFLDELPPERFDFTTYVADDWDGSRLNECGTAACALGWATEIPEFRSLGLRLCDTDYGGHVTLEGTPGSYEYEAAEAIFGVTSRQFERLFLPGEVDYGGSGLPGNATPKEVAANIRRRVEGWTETFEESEEAGGV